MSSMDLGAPLLNDYKLAFFAKRFPQTLLGGLKLRLGYEAPFYVYFNQVLFFLLPLLLAGLFTGLSESQVVDPMVCCYVFASLVTCLVIALNLAVWFKGRRYTNISKIQPNVLAEEDEVDFESCCGLETLEFIFTSKKSAFRIFVHGVLSGVLCGLMFIYLLPANLNRLYSSTVATVLLYIFGWITVCIAQYSLTASPPPEPATFRTQMPIDIAPFMRPFYAVLFGIMGVIAGSHPVLLLVDPILHAVFPFITFPWIFGILPPLDALFPWLLEQILVFGLGGSPMATDLRLLIMVFLSSIPVLLAVFIPNHTAAITLCCVCGYVLSLDLISFFPLVNSKTLSSENLKITKQWSPKEIIVSIIMFVLGIVCAAIGNIMSDKVTAAMFKGFGVGFCVVLVILQLLAEFQGVYIFGIVRNPYYPTSMQSGRPFKNRKRQLQHVARLYHFLLTYVCPLVMTAFLGLFLKSSTTGFLAVLAAFGNVRVLRQVWQNTFLCLLDICVVCLIDTSWWLTADLAIQLLITALCRDRVLHLIQKTSFLLTLAITSVSLKKQRHKVTPAILILTVLFLPALVAIVMTTVLLSAPLLPLFCLPIFLVGFPRPLRSWPQAGDTKTSSGADAVYYKQLTPKVVTFLSQSLACGTLGWRQAGEHFLLRFQDRMVWIHVVESGYRFSAVVVKGLELQETSCHTLEAARVDEMFESAFQREETQSKFYFNPNFMNTLKPRDIACFDSYSDARNVLTGIIDQPDNLWKVSENFVKTFLWVLIHYCKNSNANMRYGIKRSGSVTGKEDNKPANPAKTVIRMQSRDDSSIGKVNTASEDVTSTQAALLHRSGSLPSINGSLWSQESYELETIDSSTEKSSSKPVTAKKKSEFESLECFLDDVITTRKIPKPHTPEQFVYGFPAVDIGAASHRSDLKGTSPDTVSTFVSITQPQNNNTNKTTLTEKPLLSKHSYQLDLPPRWKANLPHTDRQLKPLFDKFPKAWYEYILNNCKLTDDDSVASDSELMERYKRLVLNCYAVVEMLGYPGSSSIAAGPLHIYKVFNGHIPWSIHLDWLQKDSQLLSIVLKSYRYAFKLMYDEAVLGEIDSHEECAEFAEYLSEYDKDWFIGQDTDEGWAKAVINDKPNLLTLGRNKDDGTYTSRVLTRQAIRAPVGQLNGEAVRGQWASLALELLYFTNDDEERYSIQAHPVLLRNLTIQAADPPLGYPVYSSGLLSIPVFVAPL